MPTTFPSRLPLLGLCFLLLLAGPLQAEGFRSPTIGTAGLAASGGRAAFIDDASALAHNPANLPDLPDWQISAEPTFVHHSVQYESLQGTASAHTQNPWKLLPHLFAAGPISSNLAVGLALTVPYGLSVDWDPNGALHAASPHFVDLKTFNFNPTLAWRPAPWLSLAAGLDVMWSELHFEQYIPLAPGLEAESVAKGDGTGVSGNLALSWRPHPRHRLALGLRAPMDIDYNGHMQVAGVPSTLSPLIPGTSPFASRIQFPTLFTAAYGFQLHPRLRLETDLEWIQFSRFDQLPIQSPQPLLGLPTTIPQNWKDTVTLGLGAAWQLHPRWTLRAGYQYFQSPVPEYTFSPSIPDANQNVLTLGLAARLSHATSLQLAYGYVAYQDRTIAQNQNPAFLGHYQINAHLLSAALQITF